MRQNSPAESSPRTQTDPQVQRATRRPCGNDAIVSTLASVQPYATLDRATLELFARHAHRRMLVRGEPLWRAGVPATHFHLVTCGLVKIVRSEGASDAIVALFGPRESVGDAAIVARGKYPADAIAGSASVQVLAIEGNVVLDAMTREPTFAAAMNRALLHHTETLQEKIRIMSAGTVPRRLATLLLGLAERFGDELDDGSGLIVPVALSRIELARLVGATVETTIRTMSAWQKRGLVETVADGFVVTSVDRLRGVASGEMEERIEPDLTNVMVRGSSRF